MIYLFLSSFGIYLVILNLSLALLIRPKFLFKKPVQTKTEVIVAIYLILFLSSFWLGMLTYFMKEMNNLIIL